MVAVFSQGPFVFGAPLQRHKLFSNDSENADCAARALPANDGSLYPEVMEDLLSASFDLRSFHGKYGTLYVPRTQM